jgi:hypothetical protein
MNFRIQTTFYIYNSSRRACSTIDSKDVTTTANVPDNKMCVPVTSSSSSVFSLLYVLYMIADPGYDDKNLYKYSKRVLEIDRVCPLLKDMKSSKERIELMLLSLGIGAGDLQPEKDIHRTVIDRAHKISV